MSSDCGDKILLSLTSTAIIGASAMTGDSIEAYYLFPCINTVDRRYRVLCNKVDLILDELHNNDSCKNSVIINDINKIPVFR